MLLEVRRCSRGMSIKYIMIYALFFTKNLLRVIFGKKDIGLSKSFA